MGDAELVARALAGDRRAYESLVLTWAPAILAVCRFRVRDARIAEDLSQETLFRGYRHLSRLREPGQFGAWLRGIAERVCRDWHRRRRESTLTELGEARTVTDHDRSADPALRAEEADERRMVRDAVAELPDPYRETIALYYSLEDATYEELGLLLGVSAATINLRLTRGRALLRARLERARR